MKVLLAISSLRFEGYHAAAVSWTKHLRLQESTSAPVTSGKLVDIAPTVPRVALEEAPPSHAAEHDSEYAMLQKQLSMKPTLGGPY